jgi:hypothetical protein
MKTLLLILLSFQLFAQYPQNIVVGQIQIQADDPEGDPIQFKIVEGDPQHYFWITNDGVVMVKREAYSTFSRYRTWTLIVICSDPKGASTKFIIDVTLRKNKEGRIIKPNPEHYLT